MKLFTVGPTQMSARTLEVSGRQVPYFRNQEFSDVVMDCERLVKKFASADDETRMILLTASGTGAMEATVINCLDYRDKVLVIDGGTFGHRFAQLCDIHHIPYTAVTLKTDEELSKAHLEQFDDCGYTALLVNLDETSTGQLYDIDMLAHFTAKNNMLLIVDAISAFLSDRIDMAKANIDVLIISSQKGIAIAPGISLVLLSKKSQNRLADINCENLYFDFQNYLANGLRGQTPFTPAVGIVYELQDRLHAIDEMGGCSEEISRVARLASDFRSRIANMPIKIASFRKSNAVTRIMFEVPIAAQVSRELIARYGFVLNPCGGEMADYALRVAHIGDLTLDDNAALVSAIKEVMETL